jgi:thiamine biosynthesis lipoprotein
MAGPLQPYAYPFHAMGSPCELRLYSESRIDADALASAARLEIGRIERKYSRYLGNSLTTRINRSAGSREGVVVDNETASLLDYADVSFRQSGGLFDITSGVLRRAWNFKTGRIPAQARIDALLPAIGWPKVRWERPRIILPVEGMEIDLGGYVKEYAADRVAALCRERGALHGLVDLGGDLSLIGPHPDGEPWKVGVRHPRRPESALASIALASGAIASSGDYERVMIIDGVRYSHLLDPRTGWPVQGLAAVSVVASHCLIAGTASTIAMLKGAEGIAWLDELGLPNLRMDREGRISGTLAFRSAGAEGQDR